MSEKETVTVRESCSCGSSFDWDASGIVAALQATHALQAWRREHRHEPAPAEAGAEAPVPLKKRGVRSES